MQFRILGPLEVQVDEGWSGINAAKWRTVLAVLLLQPGQVVSTDRLITEVWPDDTPNRATNLISVYVHRLRRLIGDPDGKVLTTRAPGYQLLIDAGDIDAGRFAQLTSAGRQALSAGDYERASSVLGEAVGLWQGSRALADVPPSALVSAEASRLEESRIEAMQLSIQADLGCGRHGQVVSQLHRLLADYPLREELWALLMRALQGSGRQAEALEAYAQAREVIAEELGVDPSAELQQLYQRMLQADSGAASASPTPIPADSPFLIPVTPAPVEPAPAGQAAEPLPEPARQPAAAAGAPLPLVAQLPADIQDFTGRDDQVQALRDLLGGPRRVDSPGAVIVAAVIGAGGLGKTTLAVHAAHLLRSQFPDGQLYARMLGAAAHPATPGDVLARFLRDLGMDPARIPASEEERAAHYRSRLTDRKVLIVLDDAHDAAQVRPLLPGSASCAVLITTRNRLPDLSGSRYVDLDVLGPAEARAMFAGIIGPGRAAAEPEAASEVLTACAGLPLAIRIAGARLTARTNWTVRTIADRLSDERRRLDWLKTGDLAVRACFEVSFTSLPGRAEADGVDPAHAFRLLGLWPGSSVGLPAAAALLGEPDESVADALEVLVDAQLLQEPAADRYRFHDLLKAYAAERAVAEEVPGTRDAAVRRVLSWYLHTAVAMARVLSPHRELIAPEQVEPGTVPVAFSTVEAALDWGEQERTNLVAATRLAAAAGLHDVAWQLPVAAYSFFYRRTYWEEWLVSHDVALDSVRRIGDRRGEASVLNNIGMAYARRRMEEGVTYFQQTLDIRREIGDRRGEAQAANNAAYANLLLGRFDEALDQLRLALSVQREVGHRYGEGIALNNLGEAYIELGRPAEAVEWFGQALAVYRELGARPVEADTLSNLGTANANLGRLDEALGYLRQAEETHHEVGDRYGEAVDLKQLGEVHRRVGSARDAEQAWARALTIFDALGNAEQVREMSERLSGLSNNGAGGGGAE
ncbi:MAG TPA: BTAD domain-containing putative transcriptional regulator [Streptosporangiaceae bacterium]|jgi:DNA-binding SARP family transcriptional activator/Tfp pilus assembly protein PilF